MFIKVRRDTLIILILAFVLILSGRAMTYVAFASSDTSVEDGVPIAGVMIKGNDIVPLSTIKSNVQSAGFRDGSYIKGNTLITSQRQLLLSDAIQNAEQLVKRSTIPGTAIAPINVADVQVDSNTGNVVVTVVEDFSVIKVESSNQTVNSAGANTETG